MSSYLTDPTSAITLDSNGDSVQVGFVTGRGGDCSAVKNGNVFVGMQVINPMTFKIGAGGTITVSNVPSGTQPQIQFQLNGFPLGTINLSSGTNNLGSNGTYIPAQSYNSNDVFTMWVGGGGGTTFTFDKVGSVYVSFFATEVSMGGRLVGVLSEGRVPVCITGSDGSCCLY